MSRGSFEAWRVPTATTVRTRVVLGWLALAVPGFTATAIADDGSTTGATAPAQPPSADTAAFETFVREVGIDMATVPVEVRREWANAPKLGITDCGIPGTHAGHSHGKDSGEQAAEDPGAGEKG